MHPFNPSHLDFFGSRRWRVVLVELTGVSLGDVVIVEPEDHDLLFPAEGTADFNPVAGTNKAIWFRRLPVYRKFSAPAGLLRLRARAEQAGDIEPDVQSKGVDRTHASNCCTARDFC